MIFSRIIQHTLLYQPNLLQCPQQSCMEIYTEIFIFPNHRWKFLWPTSPKRFNFSQSVCDERNVCDVNARNNYMPGSIPWLLIPLLHSSPGYLQHIDCARYTGRHFKENYFDNIRTNFMWKNNIKHKYIFDASSTKSSTKKCLDQDKPPSIHTQPVITVKPVIW